MQDLTSAVNAKNGSFLGSVRSRDSADETRQTPKPGNARHTPVIGGQSPDGRGSPALTWLLALLDAAGSGPPGATVRQCPAHHDTAPSLSVGTGHDGKVLLHCHAGCTWQQVLTALALSPGFLRTPPPLRPATWANIYIPAIAFPPIEVRGGHPAGRGLRLAAVHDYGQHRLERWRHPATGAKDLRWFTIRDGVAIPGLFGTKVASLPLYREHEAKMAVATGEPVIVCESESSVDAFNKAGIYATTWAGGAGAPNLDRLAAVLVGANVVLVPDADPPGRECGRRIWDALHPVASSLRCILPGEGQDARDLLAAKGPLAFISGRQDHAG